MRVEQVIVRQVSFPLTTPYKLSTGDKLVFDPYVIEVRAEDQTGWGECMVSPGYTTETRHGSWKSALDMAQRLIGAPVNLAGKVISGYAPQFPGISSAMYGAIDMLNEEPLLRTDHDTKIPLLAPCQAHEAKALQDEIEQLIEEGFKTLKVKVGYKWQDDLDRVSLIQAFAAGRVTVRLDANRGFNESDGKSFSSRLNPVGIELFEQPCASDDWGANSAVAAASTVPVMLDESIYGIADIDRAAKIENVGFVKLKLKKIGKAHELEAALNHIRELGMTPVLGDGVSLEIACWMEARVGSRTISNAGEMNGFLKARSRLFQNPLVLHQGAIHLPAGYWPIMDRDSLIFHTIKEEKYGF